MKQRINYSKTAPKGIEILHSLENYIKSSGLEASLLELVRMRASQINNCAYCIDESSAITRTLTTHG